MNKVIVHKRLGILVRFIPEMGAVSFSNGGEERHDKMLTFEEDHIESMISQLPNQDNFNSEIFTVTIADEHLSEKRIGLPRFVKTLDLIKHYPELGMYVLSYLARSDPFNHTRH